MFRVASLALALMSQTPHDLPPSRWLYEKPPEQRADIPHYSPWGTFYTPDPFDPERPRGVPRGPHFEPSTTMFRGGGGGGSAAVPNRVPRARRYRKTAPTQGADVMWGLGW